VTAREEFICERFDKGESFCKNEIGRYYAAARVDTLPEALSSDYRIIHRGYAVGFGKWYFFEALEPALTFGRAARMSVDCRGYGVYEAAEEVMCCTEHNHDEWALHVLGRPGRSLDRKGKEVEAIKRFAQCVKENPGSSYWHEPTGYLKTAMGINSGRKSLPL
jgi:hypothetical protein